MPLRPDDPARRARLGMWLGVLGVTIFGFTIPMTRLAEGLDAVQLSPMFVALGRAGVAGLLSIAWLAWHRARWPARTQWRDLAWTAAGCVFGWPLFMGYAVLEVGGTHASVVVGLLPLATAAVGAWWLHQKPSLGFWACAVLGALLVIAFAAWRGAGRVQPADLLLLGGVLSCAVGYVAGARLSLPQGVAGRPGPTPLTAEQVICWALVLALPITLPTLVVQWPDHPVRASAWIGFGYVAVFSVWIGFFAWYRGLAWGGALRVSQVQVLQPFVSLLLSAPILGERIDATTLAFGLAVMACVFLGRRMSVDTRATVIPPRMSGASSGASSGTASVAPSVASSVTSSLPSTVASPVAPSGAPSVMHPPLDASDVSRPTPASP
ncbi:MAG TPA: DMT family transporter [Burkholderiaceae bacterium]|nr:DMT family transporter [Burkholderiaceae bacterium]